MATGLGPKNITLAIKTGFLISFIRHFMSDPLELSHSSGKFDRISDCRRQKQKSPAKYAGRLY